MILALHLLNTVDIPLGDVQETNKSTDYTQWVVVKDLTNKSLYFRSYEDPNVYQVDMSELDLSPGAPTEGAHLHHHQVCQRHQRHEVKRHFLLYNRTLSILMSTNNCRDSFKSRQKSWKFKKSRHIFCRDSINS